MTDMIQRVAMKAVIVKDGKVLLLREAKTYKDGTNIGRFHMPGGRLDARADRPPAPPVLRRRRSS